MEVINQISEPRGKFNKNEYNKKYNKKYYEQNKDYWKQHFNCECGGKYTVCNKPRHFASKKHINMMAKIASPPDPEKDQIKKRIDVLVSELIELKAKIKN